MKPAAPQMVILDLSMPGIHGTEAIREVKIVHPEAKVLILTMHKEYLYQALSAGADGYLLKEDTDRISFRPLRISVKEESMYPPASRENSWKIGSRQGIRSRFEKKRS